MPQSLAEMLKKKIQQHYQNERAATEDQDNYSFDGNDWTVSDSYVEEENNSVELDPETEDIEMASE